MESTQQPLEPLAYHVELRDYLKTQERELWNWFASARAQADYTENLRLELLKSTYRLDAEGHPELYQGLAEAKVRLGLDIPVTLYQAQSNPYANATLFFIPGEGHIVFSGPVLTLMNAEEIKSILGHELAHYHLWQWQQGDLHIVDRLIQAVAHDPRAASSHENTARLYQLYTEIFADRGSLRVTGDLLPVIAGLVKVQTGLAQVSAAGYLKQAEEVFAKGDVVTEQVSHPKLFIRARALKLWQEQPDEAAPHIVRMIEGVTTLDELDLMGQMRQVKSTRRLLEQFLQPKWFQTTAVLGHAKLFFPDFKPAAVKDDAVISEFKQTDAKLREYLCYVLLDFVTVDPELDEVPLAAALALTQQLDLEAAFEKLAAKELKKKVRDVRKLKEQAAELLAKAEVAA
ncbi:MAG TPA: M48 family metalloprotease [Verrucomicrobiae bacterium]|nr:M48 family metalloprotease [Verrucomicrobiae bacterium]